MDKIEIQIITPEIATTGIEEGLVKLTEELSKHTDADLSGGLLGGEFGYGAYFENDVFMMHPFCWCEKDDCLWCLGCSCEGHYEPEWDYMNQPYNNQTYVLDRECDYCKGIVERAPNFLYKPTNCKIHWYKWIGRSQEQQGDLPVDWLIKCILSFSVPTS